MAEEPTNPIAVLSREARMAVERDRALAAVLGVFLGALRAKGVFDQTEFDQAIDMADGLLMDAETGAGGEIINVVRLTADQISDASAPH